MKKLFIALLAVLTVAPATSLFAQGKYGKDSTECIKYMSYYTEYYKQKNYDEAYPNWEKAYSICPPSASQNMFIHGATLVKNKLNKTTDAAQRAELIDLLVKLYDVRAENYPKNAVAALNNKGLDVANVIKNDPQRVFDIYSSIISANKEQTKNTLLLLHMNAALDLFKDGKIGTEEIMNIYQNNIAILDKFQGKTEDEKKQNANIKSDLESLFISSKVASCDKLIELFTPRYEANPDDLDLVTNIVKMMTLTEDCTSNDLYLKSATAMYKLDPSATSAYFLFKLNSSRGNAQDAIKYIEEAIESDETDATTDAEYYYELATVALKANMLSKSYDAATKALNLDGSLAAKCHFLMGTIWGSTSCGGNEIERRAPYWVAVDYLQKAKAEDESLSEDANKLIASFRAYFPATADAFMYDLKDGESYTVSCNGMRATTTVRTQK